MKINDIFKIEQYDEAYQFVSENEGTTIIELEPKMEDVEKTREVEKTDSEGNVYKEEETYIEKELVRYYQLVEIVVPTPTVEEQNEAIRLQREKAYQETSDHLKQDYDEALARGEADTDAKRILWLESKDKVRADNPYVVEEEPQPEPTPEPKVIPSEEPQPEEVFPDNNGIVDNQVIDK